MFTATLVSLVVLLLCFYTVKNAYKRPKNFPPGPPSLPVYGAYWIVLALEYSNLAAAFIKLGKYYSTGLVGLYLGPVLGVVINDPELAREMLRREEFDGRLDLLLGRLRANFKKLGIFFTDGDFWHVQRRFSLRHMRDFGFGRRCDTLESVVAHGIRDIIDMRINGPKYPAEEEFVKGELVQFPHYIATPFMNGMMSVFIRTTLERKDYHSLWDVAKGALLFQRSSDDLGRALCLTPILKTLMPNFSGYNDLRKGNLALREFFEKLIEEAAATHDDTQERHFLDLYIKRMKDDIKEYGKSSFSVEQLVMTCIDYMFPASSCNEMLLSIMVERLLLQPEVQDRVHEEIDRVVGKDRAPTLDDRQHMPYTESCLREMMRYETIVPLGLPHRTTRDTQLGGYDIPENTMVAANYIPMNMSKELWGDPENFRPERFIVDGKLCLSKDKSLPFGAGRRLCAGETFARQTMFQVFAGFMQAFKVSSPDGKPFQPLPRIAGIITTVPEFWVKVTPRI